MLLDALMMMNGPAQYTGHLEKCTASKLKAIMKLYKHTHYFVFDDDTISILTLIKLSALASIKCYH